jgi:hypothetical protein
MISLNLLVARRLQFEVHAIWNYPVVQPSDCNSQPGLWPDALIPVRDLWYREARAAFPIRVDGQATGGVWIDVFTPPTMRPGNYSGSVTVTYNTTAYARNTTQLPFTMFVANVTLPSVSPRRTFFSYMAASASFGPNYTVETLGQQYMELGLMHRISLGDAFDASPQLNSVEEFNWTTFDAQWGKYLRGADMPFGLQGARVTTFIMPAPISDDEFATRELPDVEAQQQYWSNVSDWFRREGLLSSVMLVDHTIDEPADATHWQDLRVRAAVVRAADPAILTLATTSMAQVSGGSGSGPLQ